MQQIESSKAQYSLRGRGGKYDRAMYYRRPSVDRVGRPLEQAGWIVIGSRTHQENMQLRGFEPLHQFGYIPSADPELRDDDGKPAPLRSPWYPILAHPDGPKVFPAEQVLTFRWYNADECPNPNAKFPQLGGHKVTRYPCPECTRIFDGIDDMGVGIRGLATHLRLMHRWDRPSTLEYGKQVGIDFNVVYGDLKETFEFSAEGSEDVLSCDECDYVVTGDSKNPKASLRMHKMSAHKPLEVSSVG